MSPERGDEFTFLEWIRSQKSLGNERLEIDVGDDACALNVAGQKLVLITADMLLEGTHFDLASASPRQVGRKAVAVNLSDVAAMGVPAALLLVTVGLTRGCGIEFARELYHGMRDLADRFSIPIAGGDVTSWSDGFAISVTAVGTDEGLDPVRRSGAQPGDVICVTGKLGGSRLGHHLDFVPRLHEGVALNRDYKLHAMIDISDGLVADLGHILAESGVAAEVDVAELPVSTDAEEAAERSGRPALAHALTDGEDFELLFTLSESEAERLLRSVPFDTPVTRIGHIVTGAGLKLLGADGRPYPLDIEGYEHTF